MSLGGDIMEEHYDKLIQDFLKKLLDLYEKAPVDGNHAVHEIIQMYKEHFKNSGIYTISGYKRT